MKHAALRVLVCALFLGSDAIADDARPAAAATPPPKKKRGELEAEEEPAPVPPSRDTSQRDESYNVALQLIGTWESAGRTLTIQQTGAYTLAGAESDAGFLRASLGLVWRKPNRTQRWMEGRYTFRSIGTVEIEGIFGTGEWKRVR